MCRESSSEVRPHDALRLGVRHLQKWFPGLNTGIVRKRIESSESRHDCGYHVRYRRPAPYVGLYGERLSTHGLIQRDGRSYSYRLTEKGIKIAAMFVLFHKRVCGPLANTLFHHRPVVTSDPPAKIETASHKADLAIQKLIDLIAA
jgi:hypothetical protein